MKNSWDDAAREMNKLWERNTKVETSEMLYEEQLRRPRTGEKEGKKRKVNSFASERGPSEMLALKNNYSENMITAKNSSSECSWDGIEQKNLRTRDETESEQISCQ